MAYTKTTWLDRVVQYASRYTKSNESATEVTLVQSPGVVTQAGTLATAALMNKMEQGIYEAHESVFPLQREVATLKAVSSLSNRIDGASKLYYDIMNGTNAGSIAKLDTTSTKLSSAASIGNTSLSVLSSAGFVVGQEVTIQDDANKGYYIISSIPNATTLTVNALSTAFKVSANVYRSIGVLNTTLGQYGFSRGYRTIDISMNNKTLVAANYVTGDSSSRKIVRLSNGWLVTSVVDTTNGVKLYISKDEGKNWIYMAFTGNSSGGSQSGYQACTLEYKDNTVFLLTVYNDGSSRKIITFSLDTTLFSSTVLNLYTYNRQEIDTTATSLNYTISASTNLAKTEIHATFMGRYSTYPNTNNVRYCKGTINTNGTITWGSVSFITTYNNATFIQDSSSIIVNTNGYPVICCPFTVSGSNNPSIYFYINTGSGFSSTFSYIYLGSHAFAYISGIRKNNGKIFFSIPYMDTSGNFLSLMYVSTDNGSNFTQLSTVSLLTSQGSVQSATLTSDADSLFLVYKNNANALYYKKSTNEGTSWSASGTLITSSGGDVSCHFDTQSTIAITTPLCINTNNSIVYLNGEMSIGSSVLSEDVRFNIIPTSNIGNNVAWVDYDTISGFSIDAKTSFGTTESYANMNKTSVALDGDTTESQFVLTNQTPQSKGTLRLTMTRTTTSIDGKINSVLGGVS